MQEQDKTSVSGGWASVKLTTIGEGCRAMLRESVSAMIGWVVEQLGATVKKGRNAAQHLRDLLRQLGLTAVQCPHRFRAIQHASNTVFLRIKWLLAKV